MLLFADSFDGYSTSQISRKWTAAWYGGSPGPVISSSAGRFGSNALVMNDFIAGLSGTNDYVAVTLGPHTTYIVGCAFKRASGTNVVRIVSFYSASTLQCALELNADGTLSMRNGGGTVLGTSVAALNNNIYSYIEVKVTIGSSGSYEVRIDRQPVLTGVGVDTEDAGNNTANMIVLGTAPSLSLNTNMYWDDVYICDNTGSTNNDFLGDVHIQILRPNGVGNTTQWDRVDQAALATENYQVLDETPPNDDQDYVQTATNNNKDTYQFEDLTISAGTIYAVVANACARHANAGASMLKHVVRHSGTDYDGAAKALDGDYKYLLQIYETNPGTSAAWTISDVNDAEFGIKLSA